jgi:hypothetical protein
MNIERLNHLITILRGVPPVNFDLQSWKCGTSACAVGWACQDPVFKEQGLHLKDFGKTHMPTYGKHSSWDAVCEFFDLAQPDALRVFDPCAYPYHGIDVKPEQVIFRIENLIKEYQHV